MKQCFQEDPGRLNLYYPCFLESFSTEEQILSAKALACMSIGEEEDISEELFFSRIAETAAGWDIHFEPSYLRFKNGGKSVPLMIYTRYLEELLLEEFVRDAFLLRAERRLERKHEREIPAHLDWQKSITELIRVHELMDEMIVDFQALLHCKKEGPVKIVFEAWDPEEADWNFYRHGERALFVHSVPVILHEYIHWLHYNLTNNPYYVIGAYLAETYGEEAFANMIVYPEKVEELSGKTMDEIMEDWSRHVEEQAAIYAGLEPEGAEE